MCCAKVCACVFTRCFEFWVCIYNPLLALFFAMFLHIPSFIFVDKLCAFALFAFCRLFSVPPPRFDGLSAFAISFLLRSGLQIGIIWGEAIRFVVFLLSFPLFFAHFEHLIFSCFAMVLHRFVIVCFPLFCTVSCILAFCNAIYICTSCHKHPLFPQYSSP